jgi:hypothetical protein
MMFIEVNHLQILQLRSKPLTIFVDLEKRSAPVAAQLGAWSASHPRPRKNRRGLGTPASLLLISDRRRRADSDGLLDQPFISTITTQPHGTMRALD